MGNIQEKIEFHASTIIEHDIKEPIIDYFDICINGVFDDISPGLNLYDKCVYYQKIYRILLMKHLFRLMDDIPEYKNTIHEQSQKRLEYESHNYEPSPEESINNANELIENLYEKVNDFFPELDCQYPIRIITRIVGEKLSTGLQIEFLKCSTGNYVSEDEDMIQYWKWSNGEYCVFNEDDDVIEFLNEKIIGG